MRKLNQLIKETFILENPYLSKNKKKTELHYLYSMILMFFLMVFDQLGNVVFRDDCSFIWPTSESRVRNLRAFYYVSS